jgi:hypothetical protein
MQMLNSKFDVVAIGDIVILSLFATLNSQAADF